MLSRAALLATLLVLPGVTRCAGTGAGPTVRVRVPPGASFAEITDSLAAKDLVEAPILFRVYARVAGADDDVKPGTYAFRRGTGWSRILEVLRSGRAETARLVIPEGWDLRRIIPAIAQVSGLSPDSVLAFFADSTVAGRYGVPGPTLEGYLYPATYTFPVDLPLDTLVGRVVAEYRKAWTPKRQARADSLELDQREIVTLASIIEREAKIHEEMPVISAVYHNRLRIGYPLQADPTVQYALGEHQQRLLRAHIDSVAENPYNTYAHPGLPPGPIASPSIQAIDAALYPADVNYLYFVAHPSGRHIFTRSLDEHNRVRAALRREARRAQQAPTRP